METTLLLAKLLGVMYLVVGLGMLVNGKLLKSMLADFAKSPGLSYSMGMMILVACTAAVLYHNLWEGGWHVVLVTLFMWAGLLKGALFIIAPKMQLKMAKSVLSKMNTSLLGVLVLAMGVLFSYIGFYM